MKLIRTISLTLALIAALFSSAFAVFTISENPIVFGSGSSNKTAVETANTTNAWITKTVVVTWDKQGSGNNTCSIKIKSIPANLDQSGGASSTKPVSDIEFSTNQLSWDSLSTTQKTIASGLTNPASGTQTLTVYLRVKASFADTVTNETGATWSLTSNTNGNPSNLEWEITSP